MCIRDSPYARRRGLDRSGPLRQQGGNDSREHISAAAPGQTGTAGGIDQHVALRHRHHRPMTLEPQHASMRLSLIHILVVATAISGPAQV